MSGKITASWDTLVNQAPKTAITYYEDFRPCSECGNHLVKGEYEKDTGVQWLQCLVCGFDCIA